MGSGSPCTWILGLALGYDGEVVPSHRQTRPASWEQDWPLEELLLR